MDTINDAAFGWGRGGEGVKGRGVGGGGGGIRKGIDPH